MTWWFHGALGCGSGAGRNLERSLIHPHTGLTSIHIRKETLPFSSCFLIEIPGESLSGLGVIQFCPNHSPSLILHSKYHHFSLSGPAASLRSPCRFCDWFPNIQLHSTSELKPMVAVPQSQKSHQHQAHHCHLSNIPLGLSQNLRPAGKLLIASLQVGSAVSRCGRRSCFPFQVGPFHLSALLSRLILDFILFLICLSFRHSDMKGEWD